VSNVTLFHEAPLEVQREEPAALLDLLRVAGVKTSEGTVVEAIDTEVVDGTPAVRRADFVALLKQPERDTAYPAEIVILEVQRERDEDKHVAWVKYVVLLHEKHRLPVRLLVLVFDRDIARWARRAHTIGPDFEYRPAVIGPDEFPEIASTEDALAAPSLAVLTALTHLSTRDESAALSRQDEIVRIFEAILRGEETRFKKKCLSLLHGVARKSTRGILEGLMEAYGMGALDLIRAEGRAEGKAEGFAEGEVKGRAKTLVDVLRARGVALGASAEQRILATRDLTTLDRWLHRALTALTIDDVLD
jgi:hypothetical protein